MEVYLEVDEENIERVSEVLDREVELGEELVCDIYYDKIPAEPSVGFMHPSIQINDVLCEGKDVSSLFSENVVYEKVYQELMKSENCF